MDGNGMSGLRAMRRPLLRGCKASILLVVALTLLSGCAWLDTKQRGWIYRPTPGVLADWKPITAHDEPIYLSPSGLRPDANGATGPAPQRLRAIWVPAEDPQAPAVLYLHGTFRNLFQNRPKIAAIHDAGFSVLAVEYRGWGESTPLLPSEASIVEDAELAWIEFQRRVPQARDRIIFGHSMGSGVAVELALRHREPPAYGALVLESAMTSMPDIARDQGMLGSFAALLTTQHFASVDKIADISVPKWFLTGSADNTVPSHQSQRLYDTAQGDKHLELFKGGSHSGLAQEFPERYRAVWRDVAAKLAGGAQPALPAASASSASR